MHTTKGHSRFLVICSSPYEPSDEKKGSLLSDRVLKYSYANRDDAVKNSFLIDLLNIYV